MNLEGESGVRSHAKPRRSQQKKGGAKSAAKFREETSKKVGEQAHPTEHFISADDVPSQQSFPQCSNAKSPDLM
jgi:hypothetical protein